MVYISGSIRGTKKGLRRASTKLTMVASFDKVTDAGRVMRGQLGLQRAQRRRVEAFAFDATK